jgi:hypothetical protein
MAAALKREAPPSPYQIQQALAAAKTVIDSLVASDLTLAEDTALLADVLDGETDVYDIVRRLVRVSIEADSFGEAVEQRIADLNVRKQRFKARYEASRAAVVGMLSALGQKRVDDPEFTATLGLGPRRVIITGPVPAKFQRPVEPEPDKLAIKAEIQAGGEVENAALSNGSPTLTVHTK